jgi:hypothetical protein
MSLLISPINFPANVATGNSGATKLLLARGKTSNGKVKPLLKMLPEDGPYWRYLVELTAGDQSSALLLQGGAQLVIARTRIAGLMIRGELTKAATKDKIKLDQDTGQMACFSVGCDELGLVGVPTNWRGKPSAIHLGTDLKQDDGFAIKITMAVGYLNNDGKAGPATVERIASRIEEVGLTVSRGASLY